MKRIFTITLALVALLVAAVPADAQNFPGASGNPSTLSRPGGMFYAPAFFSQACRVLNGNSATGVATITIACATGGIGGVQLPDGTTLSLQTIFSTLTPLVVDWGQSAAEFVTPTAVSVGTCPAGNLGVGGTVQCANFTGTFSNTHGQNAVVVDGTYGLQTAINYAQQLGGGIVGIDPAWGQMVAGVTSVTGGPATVTAVITGAVVYPNVSIQDSRSGNLQYWNIGTTASAFIGTPTALNSGTTVTAQTTPAGLFTNAAAYVVCVAYVDIAGNEGACSTTASITPTAATGNSLTFTAPAASTGAVGYTVYISLTGGTYALAYQAPLTSANCTLTKVETITPACAVTNTTYNQTGSNATITALTVNTAPIALQLGGVAGQLGTGNSNAHTTYGYVSSSRVASQGITSVVVPVTTASGTLTSTTQVVVGTIPIPAGFMNMLGKTIRVCGKMQVTPSASTTIENVQIYWDGAGSNSAGSPVQLSNLIAPATYTAAAYNGGFCATYSTTVSGAGATAGTITGGDARLLYGLASASSTTGTGVDTKTAGVGSLNLAGTVGNTTRLHVVQTHTTGTDTAAQLVNLTVEVL